MSGGIPSKSPGSPGSPGSAGDSLLDVVPTLVQGLSAEARDEDEQMECLFQLSQIIDSSFGDRSYQLCASLVEHGGVACLARLCGHPHEWLHQTAMLVLGNLAADFTDVQAAFKEVGGFALLIPHIFSESPSTLTFALGAIRNTCGDRDCVAIMQKLGAMRRLQELSNSHDPTVSEYAMGCLHNATEVIAATLATRQAVIMQRRNSSICIQRHTRGHMMRRKVQDDGTLGR